MSTPFRRHRVYCRPDKTARAPVFTHLLPVRAVPNLDVLLFAIGAEYFHTLAYPACGLCEDSPFRRTEGAASVQRISLSSNLIAGMRARPPSVASPRPVIGLPTGGPKQRPYDERPIAPRCPLARSERRSPVAQREVAQDRRGSADPADERRDDQRSDQRIRTSIAYLIAPCTLGVVVAARRAGSPHPRPSRRDVFMLPGYRVRRAKLKGSLEPFRER